MFKRQACPGGFLGQKSCRDRPSYCKMFCCIMFNPTSNVNLRIRSDIPDYRWKLKVFKSMYIGKYQLNFDL